MSISYGYGYDARNRLAVAQVSGATVATYAQNALGERVSKLIGSTATHYDYDEGSHLLVESTSGSPSRDYLWLGDLPIGVIDTTGTGTDSTSVVSSVYADAQGTPRIIADASNNLVWQQTASTDRFGWAAPVTGSFTYNLRYSGQYYDQETGLSYGGQRYFDPTTGRSTQADLIGLGGGVSTYAYALNNPLRYIDPTGLWVCNGSAAQCGSFRSGLDAVRNASTSSNLDPYQQTTLANIVNAYGAEGDPSVQINFHGENTGTGGWTGKDKNTKCERVTFNDTNLNNNVNNVSADRWGAAVAHEGQHVYDDFNNPSISRMNAEINAYTSQAYYQQAIQYSEGSNDVWTYGGGINYNNIQTRAKGSNNYGGGY